MKRIIIFWFLIGIMTFGQNVLSLNKGNWWKYQYYEKNELKFEFTKKVIGDTLIENVEYSIISVDTNVFKQKEFWRVDTSKFYNKNIDFIYSLPIVYNKTIKRDTNFSPITVEVFQKKYFDKDYDVQKWIEYYDGPGVDVYNSVIFAENLGPIETSVSASYHQGSGSRSCKLVEAYIDGIKYENIVSVKNDFKTPEKFHLYQNYPNPFNPTTTIEYSIIEKAEIVINVFNLNGEIIKTLYGGMKEAGNYKVKFDASGLPSGVYFYKIISGKNSISRKMILIK